MTAPARGPQAVPVALTVVHVVPSNLIRFAYVEVVVPLWPPYMYRALPSVAVAARSRAVGFAGRVRVVQGAT